ncbi:winged helix-turn-helix transcriptional regulator [Mycolicibacterium flavescens]|uniref:MarR family transcriptional regulator n=1 Tax=Mycolicibacterium flavescens TaxID=1776 RepID=A0A1E3R9F9_MYCFV|nr:MarR family winged helix-turn-helix transcriptional regulator [Mycolicibacterium flavescens]MCV7282041.1 winged helix-turn-helix transcriptional regulator [Mycolicibacterium flavescens]ODQ86449.1 MarR family transcriptional regulator [Mycolicibacterium flavescens]
MPELSAPLLVFLARRMQTEGDVALAQFGLRARHVIALTLLRELGEQSQSDLSTTLGVDPTNVVALLNELEADGLIERRRVPQDRRRHTVSLTPAGARRLTELEESLSGVEQRVLAALDADEQAQLYKLLSRATSAPYTESLSSSACYLDGAK